MRPSMYLTAFNQCAVHRTVSRKKRSKENRTSVIVQWWQRQCHMFLQGHHTSCYKDTTQKKSIFNSFYLISIEMKLILHADMGILHNLNDWRQVDPVKDVNNGPAVVGTGTSRTSTNIQHLDKHWYTKSIQSMQTLSLYNQSFLLITMKLQKKSHYIISLKMYVVKKIRCNNCSRYLRATWFLSRLLVLGHLTHITVNFWQTITFEACNRARVVTRRLCTGCHSNESIYFSAIHR